MCRFFGIVFTVALCSLVPTITQANNEDCASSVSHCVDTAFDIFENHADDRDMVCRGTDEFLECVVNETRSCDPMIAASVKDSMAPMITMYTGEPYNCDLKNAKNEALQTDHCSVQMSDCSVFYFQATSESEHDHSSACSMFERYLDCMKKNTSSCHGEMRNFITEHSANATKEFDQAPYYCEERLNYDIEQVDKNMTECDQIMAAMDIRVVKQDYICGVYRSYFNCAIGVLIHASPRQFQLYIDNVNQISYTFRVQPYFCESEEPCMELFRSCNSSAQHPGITPCELMDVYTSCLTSGLSACAEDAYASVANTLQQLMGDIHNKYNCIEANKNKKFDDVSDQNVVATTLGAILNPGQTADDTNAPGKDGNGQPGQTDKPNDGKEDKDQSDNGGGTGSNNANGESNKNDNSHGNSVDNKDTDVTGTPSGSGSRVDTNADDKGDSESGGGVVTSQGSGGEMTDDTPSSSGRGGGDSNDNGGNQSPSEGTGDNGNGADPLHPWLSWQLVLIGPFLVTWMMT